MAAVATLGPVAVSIDAAQMGFKYFAGGVYASDACSNDDLDHAVLVRRLLLRRGRLRSRRRGCARCLFVT